MGYGFYGVIDKFTYYQGVSDILCKLLFWAYCKNCTIWYKIIDIPDYSTSK